MTAGARNKRVTLLQRVTTVGAEGEPVDTWIPAASVWAEVRPLSAIERLQAGQLQEQVSHAVTILWRSDVTHESRLQFGDRVLDVLTVEDRTEGKVELDLRCQEIED